MHYVYILYSRKLDRYYIGQTNLKPEERLNQHNNRLNPNSYTSNGIPWELYLILECNSRTHAQKVEQHIKKMKSKKYINNLLKYPEMRNKLLCRFEKQSN